MRVRRTLLYYRLLGDKDTMPPLTPQRLISAACEADLVKYGDTFRVECPARSGRRLTLLEVAEELERRVASLFQVDSAGRPDARSGSRERGVSFPP